jgi:hypothetical protein
MSASLLLLMGLSSLVLAVQGSPVVEVHQNTSTCTDIRQYGVDSPLEALVYLGQQNTLADCTAAVVQWSNASDASQHCLSACWFREVARNASNPNQCYGRTAPLWMPLPTNHVDSAVINRGCTDNGGCSYNGECRLSTGTCTCSPAWGGVRCGELQLLPVNKTRALGFRETTTNGNGPNVSTWGAAVLYDETSAQWHGFASEMLYGCGINAWESNSQIVHIVADAPLGPYTRKDVFATAFAHEPGIARGPDGEWVMLYAGYEYNASGLAACACTNCTNGITPPPGTKGCPFQRGRPQDLGHIMKQMMAVFDVFLFLFWGYSVSKSWCASM